MFPHVLDTGTGGGPKIKTPNLYNGDANELDKFKMECHLYIMAKPQQFMTEDMKIAFVLSYIKGNKVDAWAKWIFQNMLDKAEGAPTTC